jgi:hypothetical protein
MVWAGIFGACALLLQGTPHFAQMLPILSGDASWFVVIVPGAGQRKRREEPTRPLNWLTPRPVVERLRYKTARLSKTRSLPPSCELEVDDRPRGSSGSTKHASAIVGGASGRDASTSSARPFLA